MKEAVHQLVIVGSRPQSGPVSFIHDRKIGAKLAALLADFLAAADRPQALL